MPSHVCLYMDGFKGLERRLGSDLLGCGLYMCVFCTGADAIYLQIIQRYIKGEMRVGISLI